MSDQAPSTVTVNARPRVSRLVSAPFVFAIRLYQRFISPLTPPACRYYPSCSEYAVVAIQRHGLLRGSWLSVRRIGRCHPWARGGVDHVPPARSDRAAAAEAPPPMTPTNTAPGTGA
jgi:uncharacterized protein